MNQFFDSDYMSLRSVNNQMISLLIAKYQLARIILITFGVYGILLSALYLYIVKIPSLVVQTTTFR